MKLSALALIMSTIALACGVYVAVEVSRIRDELGRTRQPRERTVVADDPAALAPARRPARARAPAQNDLAQPVADAPAAHEAVQATLEERVARLEKDQEQIREESRHAPVMPFRGRKFARTVDDLARTLKLTPTQKARVEQAVERGKRQIEEIMKIPDETGKSPYERRQEQRKKMLEAVKKKDTGGLIAFAGDMFSYRDKQIPGRNATYGEEIDRVKKETRDEVASSLSADQQEDFEDTNIDPMLGGGGGTMALSVFHTETDDGNGNVERDVIVETGVEEHENVEDIEDHDEKDD
ncbi:MAG: hypothetical protein ACYTG3_19265 [Planctomycetota bacterium]